MKVRDRWDGHLRPGLTFGRFISAEVEKLLLGVEKEGAGNWTRVAAYVPGRSDSQCWRMWQFLNPDEQGSLYDGLLATKALMLPSNFVNRRDCRSDVSAADFELLMRRDGQEVPLRDVTEGGRWSTGDARADSHLQRINCRLGGKKPKPRRLVDPPGLAIEDAAPVDRAPKKRRRKAEKENVAPRKRTRKKAAPAAPPEEARPPDDADVP